MARNTIVSSSHHATPTRPRTTPTPTPWQTLQRIPFDQIPISQYNIIGGKECGLKHPAAYHIINDNYVGGKFLYAEKPCDISFEPPRVSKPRFPSITQMSLKAMQPGVLFVEFTCERHCRSKGICVHFQFVLGSKRCPDGLICGTCEGEKVVQIAIRAARKCPLHYRRDELKPIGGRPEDFLATDAQHRVCTDILRRSIQNDWKNLAPPRSRDPFNVGRTWLPPPLPNRTQLAAEEEVRVKQRDRTPQTIVDVRQLDVDALMGLAYSSRHDSLSEDAPVLGSDGLNQTSEPGEIGLAEFQDKFEREETMMLKGWEEYERRPVVNSGMG